MAEKNITQTELELETSPHSTEAAKVADGFGSSNNDKIEMQRMGKDQEMNVSEIMNHRLPEV